MGRRTPPPRVVVVEELRLVRGHVDPDRTVGAAALAGQTQVEGVPDLRRPPAVRHQLAREHLVQQPGTPARGVFLLSGRPEGRAHDGGARRRGCAALRDPDTPAHGRREVAAVRRVAEGHVDRAAAGEHGEAEVGVQRGRADQHARVEQVVRVPDRLRPLEQPHQLTAVHARQQLRPGLSVAVFAGQRAAVGDDQVGEVLREAAEAGHTRVRQQVEVDTDVDAAVAEVPVRRAAQPVRPEEPSEVAQVRAQPGRRHRAVLPAGPRLGAVRHPGRRAARVLPDAPQGALSGRVRHDQGVQDVGRAHDRLRTRACLRLRRPAGLHEQPGPAARQVSVRRHQVRRHALHGQRPERQQARRRLRGRALVGVGEHGQGTRARGLDQPYDRLRQDAQRALRAAEGPGDVGALLGQQRVQGVAGDTAGQLGEAGAQPRQVPLNQRPQPLRRPGPLLPEPQPVTARGDHRQLPDAVRRRPPRHRVGAARVVADHSAERAAAVGGGVGSEAQSVRGGGLLEPVEDQPGLHDRGARGGVEGQQPVHVPGEVQDHARPRRLPGDRRSAAACHHGHTVLPAHRQRRRHVVGVPRGDHAQRDPPVVGGVHGDQRPGGDVETDLTPDDRAQPGL